MKTIHLATDHAGYEMKEFIKSELINMGHNVIDHGANEFNEMDDYPDYVTPCAEAVAQDDTSIGIILGGSGQGEAMCANRIHGIYAGLYYGGDVDMVKTFRKHNNANILSLGARFINNKEALFAIKAFLETEFTNEERHTRRLLSF